MATGLQLNAQTVPTFQDPRLNSIAKKVLAGERLAGLIAATGEKWGWAQEGTNIREIFSVRTSSNCLLRF